MGLRSRRELLVAMSMVGCIDSGDVPHGTSGTAPVDCSYDPEGEDIGGSTVVDVAGCPVIVDGWSIDGKSPGYTSAYPLCQAAVGIDEALTGGIFAALGLPGDPPWEVEDPYFECEDLSTGEQVSIGGEAYFVDLLGQTGQTAGQNTFTAQFTWIVGADGVESVFVETDRGHVKCGGFTVAGVVAFGMPLLLPVPRELSCELK